MQRIVAAPLTRAGFAPFGDVIETEGATSLAINRGTTERFHDLARIDVAAGGGRAIVSIFRGQPFAPPVQIAMFERHPLGSQAFMPLGRQPWLVVVAEAAPGRAPGRPHAFLARPGQGASYAAGVWHHPLIALDAVSDFLVIDRAGPGENLEEHALDAPFLVDLP